MPASPKMMPKIPKGAINSYNLINLFCDLSSNLPEDADFDKFPIKFACIGTDLETGKEVVIRNGFFPTAIYSSMAIPGVFVPAHHNGYTMVDGGVVNNFPADVAKSMGADIIIGVDIRNDLYDSDRITSMKQILNQLVSFYSVSKDSVNKNYCDFSKEQATSKCMPG